MAEQVPFRLKLSGDTADYHQFQGYDGYMALAGFAWTLSLVTNFVETGKVRHRGDFPGRHAVRAYALEEGSIIADFAVWLRGSPTETFGSSVRTTAGNLLYSMVETVISRNVGRERASSNTIIEDIGAKKSGDFEALVAISEPSIRQAHGVIGNGADRVDIIGGMNIIESLDDETLEYVRSQYEDLKQQVLDVTVSAFDANPGYGKVFDTSIGRSVPITMTTDTLRRLRPTFSWGLDQYSNRTGGKVRIWFTRILAADGRPKRYVVQQAEKVPPLK